MVRFELYEQFTICFYCKISFMSYVTKTRWAVGWIIISSKIDDSTRYFVSCAFNIQHLFTYERKLSNVTVKSGFKNRAAIITSLGRASSTVHIQMIPRDGCRFLNEWNFWVRTKFFVKRDVFQKKNERLTNKRDHSEKWKNYCFLKGNEKGKSFEQTLKNDRNFTELTNFPKD